MKQKIIVHFYYKFQEFHKVISMSNTHFPADYKFNPLPDIQKILFCSSKCSNFKKKKKKKKNHTFIIYRPFTIFQIHYRYMKYMSDKIFLIQMNSVVVWIMKVILLVMKGRILMGHLCDEMSIYHPVSSIKNE